MSRLSLLPVAEQAACAAGARRRLRLRPPAGEELWAPAAAQRLLPLPLAALPAGASALLLPPCPPPLELALALAFPVPLLRLLAAACSLASGFASALAAASRPRLCGASAAAPKLGLLPLGLQRCCFPAGRLAPPMPPAPLFSLLAPPMLCAVALRARLAKKACSPRPRREGAEEGQAALGA